MKSNRKGKHLADLYVLNVGQGDSLVFHLATGEILIIDCNVQDDFNTSVIKDCIEKIIPDTKNGFDIDLLCLTHPDIDHYRGMDSLIDWVKKNKGPKKIRGQIKNLIIPGVSPKSLGGLVKKEWEKLRKKPPSEDAELPAPLAELLQKNKALVGLYKKFAKIRKDIKKSPKGKYQTANGFAHFKDFGKARVFILGPTSETVQKHHDQVWKDIIKAWISSKPLGTDSANEISSVLWIVTNKVQSLLTGDATAEALLDAINEYEFNHKTLIKKEIDCDIVKASHHGSKTGSSLELWQKILKKNGFVAFSAGAHRGYQHPDQETINDIYGIPSSKPTLFCTNCLRYAKLIDRKSDILADDDVRGRWSDCPDNSTKFHGTIRFKIFNNGKVCVKPERNPNPPCPNLIGLSGATPCGL